MSRMTLTRIRSLCEKAGDCLLWTHKTHKNGSPAGTEWVDGKDRYVAIRRRAYECYHGVTLDKGQVITTTCGDPLCLARRHLECISIGERSRRAHAAMDAGTKIRRSILIAAAMKDKRKLSDEQVEEIKSSEDGPYVTAKRLGVSGVVASRIVRDLSYRDYAATPFDGLQPARAWRTCTTTTQPS